MGPLSARALCCPVSCMIPFLGCIKPRCAYACSKITATNSALILQLHEHEVSLNSKKYTRFAHLDQCKFRDQVTGIKR